MSTADTGLVPPDAHALDAGAPIVDLSEWLRLAGHASQGRDRDFVSSAFAGEAARLEREQGPAARALFLRQVLRGLVAAGRPRIGEQTVPDSVKALITKTYDRIEKNIETAGDAHFDLARHGMRCDFRIVGFGRIPAGFGHLEVGGVPRRLLWSGGLGQARRLGALLLEAGGVAPFYVSHFTHEVSPLALMLVCNPETQKTFHRTVAECLRLNPHIRGLLQTSWWYDPAMARVTPHLAFLGEGSVARGATLLRVGATEGATKMALANSPKRQRLYEAGEYRPLSYAVVWSRQRLLQWADEDRA